VADDILEAVLAVEAGAQAANLGYEPEMFKHPFDDEAKLLKVDGLGEVIVRTRPHRMDSALDSSERGDDDDWNFRILLSNPVQEIHAGEPGHLQVSKDKRRRRLSDRFQGLQTIGRCRGLVAHILKLRLKNPPQVFIVIDNQNARPAHASVRSVGRVTEKVMPWP